MTDAMSTIGSDQTEFTLNGRTVYRSDGRLTLEDGTLAGADIDMIASVRVLVDQGGAGPGRGLAHGKSLYPAQALGIDERATAALCGEAPCERISCICRDDLVRVSRSGLAERVLIIRLTQGIVRTAAVTVSAPAFFQAVHPDGIGGRHEGGAGGSARTGTAFRRCSHA